MEEKKLTKAEIDKKEDVIKAIAKEKGGKDKLKPVDYAIATDTAKRVAEMVEQALVKEEINEVTDPSMTQILIDFIGLASMFGGAAAIEHGIQQMKKKHPEHKDAIDQAHKAVKRNPDIAKGSVKGKVYSPDMSSRDSMKGLEEMTDQQRLDTRDQLRKIAEALRDEGESTAAAKILEAIKIIRGDVSEGSDIEIGHTDNEPHMLRADLYRIAKYAAELMGMLKKYQDMEADFPHWWQSKIIKAKDYLVGAKHYLDGEEMLAQIDAMMEPEMDVDLSGEGGVEIEDEIQESNIQKLSRLMDEGKYPWEDCIADQEKRYGSKEQAEKVCGAIKAGR
jgi:hypothetical protein